MPQNRTRIQKPPGHRVPVRVAAELTRLPTAEIERAIRDGSARTEKIQNVIYVDLSDLDEIAEVVHISVPLAKVMNRLAARGIVDDEAP